MSVYKVDICGVTTSKLPVLKDDEKEELFEKIKKGDKAAREKYIRGNLRLVLSVIRRFSNHNENMDDLFQIGCIGLMKSIDNFDPTIGVKFSTYAESWYTIRPWQKYQRIAASPKTIYYTHLMQSRHRFPSLILYILTVVIRYM